MPPFKANTRLQNLNPAQQTWCEAVGADMEFIAIGIHAAFGRKDDLLITLMSAEIDTLFGIEIRVTYAGIVYEHVKLLCFCNASKHGFSSAMHVQYEERRRKL